MASKRIGTLTVGIFLVILGVLLLAHLIIGTNLPRVLIKIWPVILVALGIEILYHHYRRVQDDKLRYDLVSMLVLFLVGTSSIGLYTLQASGLLDIIKTIPQYSTYTIDIKRERVPINVGIDRVVLENGLDNVKVRVVESDTVDIQGSISLMAISKDEAHQLVEDNRGYSVRQQGKTLIIETHRTEPGKWFLPKGAQRNPLEIMVPSNLALEINSPWGNVDIVADNVERDWFIKGNGGSLDVTLPKTINATVTAEASQIVGDLNFNDQDKGGVASRENDGDPDGLNDLEGRRSQVQLGQGGPRLHLINRQGVVAVYQR